MVEPLVDGGVGGDRLLGLARGDDVEGLDPDLDAAELHALVVLQLALDADEAAERDAGDRERDLVVPLRTRTHELHRAGLVAEDEELDLLLIPHRLDPAGDGDGAVLDGRRGRRSASGQSRSTAYGSVSRAVEVCAAPGRGDSRVDADGSALFYGAWHLVLPAAPYTACVVARALHLVRHGEVHNPAGVVYERLPEFRLSDRGQAMAAKTAEWLADKPVTRLIASPAAAHAAVRAADRGHVRSRDRAGRARDRGRQPVRRPRGRPQRAAEPRRLAAVPQPVAARRGERPSPRSATGCGSSCSRRCRPATRSTTS